MQRLFVDDLLRWRRMSWTPPTFPNYPALRRVHKPIDRIAYRKELYD